MTIGEKIKHLRKAYNISQSNLAKNLNVSRQTISKWEGEESIPQLDKLREIANIFKISYDELINDEIVIHKGKTIPKCQNNEIKTKYFGTDGFRGEVNFTLTSDKAYKIGRFLGWYYSTPQFNYHKPGYRPQIVIGKDTRRSSYMLEYAISTGIAASGGDVSLMHVTTTPSVSYIVKEDHFDCGVMITASHNPFYDNGIKILNSQGEKLEDEVLVLIEAYLDNDLKKLNIKEDDLPLAVKENIGVIKDYSSGRNRYIAYLISLARHSFKKLRIGLDTANGASYMIAKSVFNSLGANVYMINDDPDGINVNVNAGSTHIDSLIKFVKENKLDIGFAFDGDADRCIAVDENGKEVDGDKMLYLLANRLKATNSLYNDTVVTTIMSNSGLTKALKQKGLKNVQTKVGDRFVYLEMLKNDYALGGEKSGHIIIRKYATTGDGILTAIMVVEEMLDTHLKLSELVEDVKLLPQVLKNVRVTNKTAVMEDDTVKHKFEQINKEIGNNGRISLRESGTEPVIRIMVEASSVKQCEKYIEKMYETIKERGFICE